MTYLIACFEQISMNARIRLVWKDSVSMRSDLSFAFAIQATLSNATSVSVCFLFILTRLYNAKRYWWYFCIIQSDYDECEQELSPCHNGTCVNQIGSYRCDCPEGYHPINDTCYGTVLIILSPILFSSLCAKFRCHYRFLYFSYCTSKQTWTNANYRIRVSTASASIPKAVTRVAARPVSKFSATFA